MISQPCALLSLAIAVEKEHLQVIEIYAASMRPNYIRGLHISP
jgi:hypothetical protein